jgi:hypothetical protein
MHTHESVKWGTLQQRSCFCAQAGVASNIYAALPARAPVQQAQLADGPLAECLQLRNFGISHHGQLQGQWLVHQKGK